MKLNPLLLCFLGLASSPVLACYTVYDKAGLVVYQGERAPVDLSEPLHVALQKAYPGGHLVFDQASNCSPVSIGQLWRSKVPHAAPNTIRREAPARPVSGVAPAASTDPAAPRQKSVTVITELHSPPIAAEQRGDRIELRQN